MCVSTPKRYKIKLSTPKRYDRVCCYGIRIIITKKIQSAIPTQIFIMESTTISIEQFSLNRFFALAMRLIIASGILMNNPAKLPGASIPAILPPSVL